MFFVLFENPLCSINGTNVKSFTQPHSKSTLQSKAENFFFAPKRTFKKTDLWLKTENMLCLEVLLGLA